MSSWVVEYKYNGLNYQIGRHADLDADADVDNTDKWEWTVYDPQWRRAATIMVAGGSVFTGSADTSVAADRIKERYVHHAAGRFGRGSYIDAVILRDRDQTAGNNGAADGTLEQRLYYCQNWRADVSVTMTDSGRILEWLKYSAYGVCQRTPMADFNHDAFVDSFDDNDFGTAYGLGSADADINYDGATNSTDNSQWNTTYAEEGYTSRGVLNENGGSAPVNRLGYAGYWFEPATQQYLVRNREFDPLVGVWDERDPIGYRDGINLVQYVRSAPLIATDPSGAVGVGCAGSCARAVRSDYVTAQPAVMPMNCSYPRVKTYPACRAWASCTLTRRNTPPGTCFDSAVDAAAQCCWAGIDTSQATCLTVLNDQYFACGSTSDPCFRVPPMEPGDVCDYYGECESYRWANARCFCLCMGSDPWSNFVCACLQCKYRRGIRGSAAHSQCYAEANRLFAEPTDKIAHCAALCWTYQAAHCAITIIPLTDPDEW